MLDKGIESYLGDAVFASLENGMIRLRTRDDNDQIIYLEREVYESLRRYAKRLGWEGT